MKGCEAKTFVKQIIFLYNETSGKVFFMCVVVEQSTTFTLLVPKKMPNHKVRGPYKFSVAELKTYTKPQIIAKVQAAGLNPYYSKKVDGKFPLKKKATLINMLRSTGAGKSATRSTYLTHRALARAYGYKLLYKRGSMRHKKRKTDRMLYDNLTSKRARLATCHAFKKVHGLKGRRIPNCKEIIDTRGFYDGGLVKYLKRVSNEAHPKGTPLYIERLLRSRIKKGRRQYLPFSGRYFPKLKASARKAK